MATRLLARRPARDMTPPPPPSRPACGRRTIGTGCNEANRCRPYEQDPATMRSGGVLYHTFVLANRIGAVVTDREAKAAHRAIRATRALRQAAGRRDPASAWSVTRPSPNRSARIGASLTPDAILTVTRTPISLRTTVILSNDGKHCPCHAR